MIEDNSRKLEFRRKMTMIIIEQHKADDEGWKTERPTPTKKLCEEEKENDSFPSDSEDIDEMFSES